MTTTRVNIVASDNTATAFRSADSRLAALSSTVGRLSGLFGALGVASAAAFAASSTRSSLEFGRSMAEVSTLIGGTTIKMSELEKAAKNLSTEFGNSPVQQTQAFYQVISAGASTSAQAIEILTAANKLAIGGVTDVAIAADGLTSILNAYGDAAGGAASVSDVLFVGMKSGKTTIEDLASGMGKVSPLAAAMNVSFEELTSSVAALTKGGISTTESISGVRAILAAVAKPSKQAADAAKELGIEFNSASIKSKGFSGFLDDVKEKTGGSVDNLARLFNGVEALIPVMALTGQAGEDFNVILGAMAEKSGATEEAVGKMQDPMLQVDKLMSELSVTSIEFGAALSTVLVPAAQSATSVLKDLREEGFLNSTIFNTIVAGPVVGFLREQAKGIRKAREQINDEVGKVGVSYEELKNRSNSAANDLKGLVDSLDDVDGKTSNVTGSTRGLTKALTIEEKEAKDLREEIKRLSRQYDPLINKTERLARLQLLIGAGLPSNVAEAKHIKILEDYARATDTATESIEELEDQTKDLGVTTGIVLRTNEQLMISGVRGIQRAVADGLFNFFDDGLKGMVRSVKTAVGRMIAEFASIKLLQSTGLFGGSNGFSVSGSGGGGGVLTASNGLSFANLARSASSFSIGATGAGTAFTAGTGGAGTAFIGGSGTAIGGSGAGAAAAGSGLGAIPIVGWAILANGIANQLLDNDKTIFGAGQGTLNKIAQGPGTRALQGLFGKKVAAFTEDPALKLITALFGRGPFKFRRQELQGTASASGFNDASLNDVFRSKGGVFRSNRTRRQSASNESDIIDFFDDATKNLFSSAGDLADKLKLSTSALNELTVAVDLDSQKKQAFTQEEFSAELSRISDSISESVIPNLSELARNGESLTQALIRVNNEFDLLVNLGNALGNSTSAASSFLIGQGAGGRSDLVTQLGGSDVVSQFAEFFANSFLTETERLKISTDNLATSLRDAGLAADLSKEQYAALVKSFGTEGGISSSQLANLIQVGPALAAIRDAAANDAFGALSRSVSTRQQEISREIGIITGRIGELSSVLNATGNAINTIFPISKAAARGIVGQAANDSDFSNPKLGTAIAALTKSSTAGFTNRVDFLRDQAQSANSLRELEESASDQLSIEEKTLEVLQGESSHIAGILVNAQLQLDALNGIRDTLSVNAAQSAFKSATTPGFLDTSTQTGSFDGPFVGPVASFHSGGSPSREGLALIKRSERVFTSDQNADLIGEMKASNAQIKEMRANIKDLYNLFRRMTDDGLSLKTKAA